MIIEQNMSMQKKLEILSDAAKYDVACTSSGVDRKGNPGSVGNTVAAGICHSFSADGRCISLLKILFTNECIFDCKYCLNRSSNDVVRATFTPEEVCTLTMEFYRRNFIEGLFLSSGVIQNPNYTMELLCQTLRMLREVYHFNGYIHCKAVPGASTDLIEMTGWYADRMSVNLELPTADGLRNLAPHKNRKNILTPMKQIQLGRNEFEANKIINYKRDNINNGNFKRDNILNDYKRDNINNDNFKRDNILNDYKRDNINNDNFKRDNILKDNYKIDNIKKDNLKIASSLNNRGLLVETNDIYSSNPITRDILLHDNSLDTSISSNHLPSFSLGKVSQPSSNRGFVPAGQSTQMIIGATPENDYQILSVTEALYQKFDLKRVFFSAFIRVNDDNSLPTLAGGPPLLREHRLYQADWLLRFYGFQASELLSEERPNFNVLLDPKCNWALGHLGSFPIEVNKADYYTLLRVPGIGVKSAQRIVRARRSANLRFEDLKKMGVVLKRAIYFITCNGQMMYPTKIEENYIMNQLVGIKERLPYGISGDITFQQLSLFDDKNFLNHNEMQNIY